MFVQHASPATNPRHPSIRARRGSVPASSAPSASNTSTTPNVLASKCGSATVL